MIQEMWEVFRANPGPQTFGPLYDHTRALVYTICYRILRNEDDAADAFQGVYSRLLAEAAGSPQTKAVDRLPAGSASSPQDSPANSLAAGSARDFDLFIRQLAVREAGRLQKQRTRRLLREVPMNPLPEHPDDGPGAREAADQNQVREKIHALTSALPDRYRLPVELFYFHGMTYEEAGRTLGLPRETVRTQVRRALSILEPKMRKAGLAESALAMGAMGGTAALLPPPPSLAAGLVLARAYSDLAALGAAASASSVSAASATSPVSAASATSAASAVQGSLAGGAAGKTALWGGITAAKAIAASMIAFALAAAVWTFSLSPRQARRNPVPFQRSRALAAAISAKNSSPETSGSLSASARAPAPFGNNTQAQAADFATSTAAAAKSLAPFGSAADTLSADLPTTEPKAQVIGRALLPDKRPAAGAVIEVLLSPTKRQLEKYDYRDRLLQRAMADAQGRFNVIIPATRPCWLRASLPGRATIKTLVRFSAAHSDESDSEDAPAALPSIERDILLQPAAPIRGIVLDASGKPLSNAIIHAYQSEDSGDSHSLYSEERITGGSGEFVLETLKEGPVEIGAAAAGHALYFENSLAPAKDRRILLKTRGASISGRVFDKITGEGAAKAEVSLFPQKHKGLSSAARRRMAALTDSTGAFRIEGLASGDYAGYVTLQGTFQWMPGEQPYEQIRLGEDEHLDNVEFFLYPGHTVRGVVTEKGTGRPIEGAVLAEMSYSSEKTLTPQAMTGPDGAYEMRGLTHANFSCEKKGYLPPLDPLNLYGAGVHVKLPKDQFEVALNVEMIEGIPVSGFVVDEKGLPVRKGRAALYLENSSPSQGDVFLPLDGEGRFEFLAPPSSKAAVVARAKGFTSTITEGFSVGDQPVRGIRVALEPGREIIGAVTDSQGNPLAGAKVNASEPVKIFTQSRINDLGETATNAEGKFRLSGLPGREICVYARKDGFIVQYRNLAASRTPPGPEVRIVLEADHFIAGRVTDQNGEPVPYVHLQAFAANSQINSNQSARTDSDGRYRIAGLAGIPHNMSLLHGKLGKMARNDVSVDREDVDFVFGQDDWGVVFAGKVVDDKTSQPITNFDVKLQISTEWEKEANNPGGFLIRGLTPGMRYKFTVSAPGRATCYSTIAMPQDQNVVRREFALGVGGTITGRILSRAGAAPMPGIGVQLLKPFDKWSAKTEPPVVEIATGPDGRFIFDKVAAGVNYVRIAPGANSAPSTREIKVENSKTADFGEILIGTGASIAGVVVRQPGEQPMSGLLVGIGSSGPVDKETKTDAFGRFEFSTLEAGHYYIKIPELSSTTSFTLDEDERREFRLEAGIARVRGKVMRGGKPCAARLYLSLKQEEAGAPSQSTTGVPAQSANGAQAQSTTGAQAQSAAGGKHPIRHHFMAQSSGDGRFEVGNLLPGQYDLEVFWSTNSNFNPKEIIQAAEGESAEITIVIPSGRIVGKVLDSQGQPARGCKVTAAPSGGPATKNGAAILSVTVAHSDQRGEFFMEVPPGAYDLNASLANVGAAAAQGIAVSREGDTAPVELRLISPNAATDTSQSP